MANIIVENKLSGETTPVFCYRKKGYKLKKQNSGGSATIQIDEKKKKQCLFYIDGSPAENNSIVIALKNFTHCIEVLNIKDGNEINAKLRFIPMQNISNDIEVKAVNSRPAKNPGIQDSSQLFVTNKYNNDRNIIAKNNGSTNNPITISVPKFDPNEQVNSHLIADFSQTDVFEFYVESNPESCRYSIRIKGFPWIINTCDIGGRIEVGVEYDGSAGPETINVTIEPD